MPYPKQILTVDELLKTYADAGMEISDCTVTRDILLEIGYYRLRGYSFHLYNHDTYTTQSKRQILRLPLNLTPLL